MSDLISRDAAIKIASGYCHPANIVKELEALPSAQPELPENWWETDHGYMWLCPHCGLPVHSDFEECLRCGTKRPSAHPELNEWCHDCKEYDTEKGCCPRWGQVIRTALEEAKPEQRWIPCSERLPEEPNMYTVTDSKGDVVRFIFYGSESSRKYWRRCAKAWMPLPEPWKGEDDERA